MCDPSATVPSVSVVAIDPGLDRVAIARFVVPVMQSRGLASYWSKALPDEKARTFVSAASFDTSADVEIVQRLADVASWVRGQLVAIRPRLILLEMPTYASTYARHVENGARTAAATASGQNKLYMSIGTILAAAWSAECLVRAVPAQSTNKKQRLQLVEMLLKAAGKARPKNEDQRDAVSIGLGATWDL
jgi:Holliday junction resolvasome RuvABC endonuclease subunit